MIWAVEHALQAASKRMSTRFNVTGTQRFVVRMVGRNPGLGAGELAAQLHDHPSTLTGVLHRLVDRGVLHRTVDAHDRRRARLELTELGRKVDALHEGTIEHAVSVALSRISQADVEVTRRVFDTLVSALDTTVK